MKPLLLLGMLLSLIATAHAGNPRVEMQTNQGTIVVELYPDKAPKTVDNFLHYVKNGFYEGTIFHRVIKNFVVQGGAFDRGFEWRKGDDAIKSEAKNGLSNEAGTIAMARSGQDPNSASTQFFFNLESNKHLNYYKDEPAYYGNAVFGKIVKGMEVVQKIADIPTGSGGPFAVDVPVQAVYIEKVAILPDEPEPKPAVATKDKTKGKSNGKTKNEPRRNLAGT